MPVPHACAAVALLLPGLLLSSGARVGRPPDERAHGPGSPSPALSNPGLLLPLRTSGRHIVDASGRRVRLACVNWYGAHMEQMVPNGLNHQRADSIAAIVAGHGFNCVRLTFSLDVVFTGRASVPDPHASLKANPELMSKSPLEVFDAALQALTDRGLMVILNNHVSSGKWCCSLSDGEGLWYTAEYSLDRWLDGLAQMAARYRSNPLVVGFDLRNEVRSSSLGDPSWGRGPAESDWAQGAVQGARRVVAESKDMLIFISGLRYGMLLCDVPREPVHLTEPSLRNRTVYTVHEYSWFNVNVTVSSVAKYFLIALLVLFNVFCGVRAYSDFRAQAEQRQRHEARAQLELDPTAERRVSDMPDQARESASRAQAARCGKAPLWLEPVVAVLLTLLALLCRYTSSGWLHTCDMWKLVAGQLLRVCCLCSSSAGLVVWLRLFLALLRRTYERQLKTAESLPQEGQPRTGALAQGVELTSRPPAEGATAAAAVAPPRRLSLELPLQRGTGSGVSLPLGLLQRRMRRLDQALSARCFQLAMLVAMLGPLVIVAIRSARYEAFAAELDNRWGFLLEGPDAAPLWLGEFGTNDPDDLEWAHIKRYIVEKDLDWAYWALNGEKYIGEEETFGLLMEDSATVRHEWKLRDLRALIRAAGLLPPERPPSAFAFAKSVDARPFSTLHLDRV